MFFFPFSAVNQIPLQAIEMNHESVISKPNSEILSLNSLLADREGLILKKAMENFRRI